MAIATSPPGYDEKKELLDRGTKLHAEIVQLDEQIAGIHYTPKKSRKLRLSQLIAQRELVRLEFERIKRTFHGWPEPGTWRWRLWRIGHFFKRA
jgi:hypothetical protein